MLVIQRDVEDDHQEIRDLPVYVGQPVRHRPPHPGDPGSTPVEQALSIWILLSTRSPKCPPQNKLATGTCILTDSAFV
jgi:hypothetical protein